MTIHARHSRPSPVESSDEPLPSTVVWKDDRVKIVSDAGLTQDQAITVAHQVEDAYEFAKKKNGYQSGWEMDKQITVVVLTEPAFNKLADDAEGLTTNRNTFIVPTRVVGKIDPDVQDTFAHELSHVQDYRAADGFISSVPTYIQEGKAYCVGDAYPIAAGLGPKDASLNDVAQELAGLTGDEAESILANYRTVDAESDGTDGYKDETCGALFVQWLNAQRKPLNDAIHLLGLCTSRTAKGGDFNEAFHKLFGMPLEDAEKQFVQFVRDTENDPQKRLADTMWAPYLK